MKERALTGKNKGKVEDFFAALADSPTSILLLDYDGTLADFRVDRFKARPWAGVLPFLEQIRGRGKTRMAIVTGRPAAEIPPLLSLNPALEVWGLHGAERLYPDGGKEFEQTSPVARAHLDQLRGQLRRDAFGGLYEEKPNAVVVHWRGRTPQQARTIEHRTRELFGPAAQSDGLRLLEFDAGLELRAGRDKGGAVREILREAGNDLPIAYLGDDITDEAAFRAVNQAHGPHLSVLMRRVPRPTEADVWLRPPEDLRWFLKRWIKAARA